MRIQKSSIVLDDNYKNVLVKDFAKNYSGVDDLQSPENIVQVMNDVFNISNLPEEYLYLICMTGRCKPISFFEVSHGTCNSSLVGCREILIRALLCGATSIIIIHNHPSGVPEPSKEDERITNRVSEAAKLMDINFCDHIVIAREGYYSFSENEIVELK
ncbi:MAG: JAB domain-containing protein [Lachnospiraceae bacterium]|nr:JAB domain-containing protein [bacterium]MDY5517658.1 JAB domain-containing protein [Lachnospiraceae bacterium]